MGDQAKAETTSIRKNLVGDMPSIPAVAGNHCAQRTNEATEYDALPAVSMEVRHATLYPLGMGGEWPHGRQSIPKQAAKPEAHPVSYDGTEGCGEQRLPERHCARRGQGAKGEQEHSAWEDDPDNRQRFTHGNQKNNQPGHARMIGHPCE